MCIKIAPLFSLLKMRVRGRFVGMKRRNFLELSFGAAFAQGVPAWEARPADVRSVKPVSIDMHTHWAPEAYVKAQVEMGRPAPANPNPLDFDLDKRRKWMDEHGVQMHRSEERRVGKGGR